MYYSYEEFLKRYYAWHYAEPLMRDDEWYQYCDARDALPPGSSKNRKILSYDDRLASYGVFSAAFK